MVGKTISHYRVVGQLGAGGMGVVYAAEDARLRRPVALKFVPEELAKDHQAVDRLRAEARAASALNHSGICTIYDIDEFENRPFIVMELMKGQTLHDKLLAGSIKIAQIVEIGLQVADALDAAHAKGIIHRDIKPANLFLTERGQVKILDFGLAKLSDKPDPGTTTAGTMAVSDQLTPEGMALGTVAYMSPEQATGEELDGRTDLFSLGVVLYECATGRRPFTGKTPAVILSAILNKAPVAPIILNPDVPPRLQDIITNCLEKDPELRYQVAAGLRADLRRVKRDLESGYSGAVTISGRADQLPRPGPGSGPISQASRPGPETSSAVSHDRTFGIGIAIAVLIGLAGAYALWSQRATPGTETPNNPAPQVETTAAVDETALDLARASLDRHDYRTALVQANAFLQNSLGHPAATEIWNTARAAIAELEESLAVADRRLAADDADGAATALARARAIDPTAPRLAELSVQLTRLRATTRAAQQARQAASARTASPAVPPPTPTASPRSMTEPASPARTTSAAPLHSAPAAVATPEPEVGTRPASPPPPLDAPPESTAPIAPATAGTPAPATLPVAPPPAAARPTVEPATPSLPLSTASKPPEPQVDHEAAIGRVIQTYARAIETKDLALFRSVKPNLSAEEERRLVESFRTLSSQQVDAAVLSIDRQGPRATVRVRRRDTITAAGRVQTTEREQTLTLMQTGDLWVIDQIGQ